MHAPHHHDKTHQMLTQLPATAYPMPCHTTPCHPVLSHPIPSHPESTFSASPRCMAMQEGFIDTKFVSLPQRRRNPWSAPLCAEVGLLLDTVGTHLLPVRVQTTHHLSFSVGGSRYYFGGLCKPPQIICKLLVICK